MRKKRRMDDRRSERTSPLSDGEVERVAGLCGNAEVDGRVGAALVFIRRSNHLHHLKQINKTDAVICTNKTVFCC